MQNILCEKPKYILNPAFKQAVLQTPHGVGLSHMLVFPRKALILRTLHPGRILIILPTATVILYLCFWQFHAENVLCVENVTPANGCFALLQRLNIAVQFLTL